MKHQSIIRLLCTILTFGLFGCSQANSIAVGTSVTSETITQIPLSTPTQTSSPTNTPTPAIPVGPEDVFPSPIEEIAIGTIDQMEELAVIGDGELHDLILSQDEKRIVAIFSSEVITVDTESFERLSEIRVNVPIGFYEPYALSPNGNYFAVKNIGGIEIFDLRTGEQLFTVTTPIDPDFPSLEIDNPLEFNGDGSALFYSDYPESFVWKLPDGDLLFKDEVSNFVFTQASTFGVSNSNQLRIFDSSNGRLINQLEADEEIESFTLSEDSELAGILLSNEAFIWSFEDQKKILSYSAVNGDSVPRFTPIENVIYSANQRNGFRIRFWDTESGSQIATINNVFAGLVFNETETAFTARVPSGGRSSVALVDAERLSIIGVYPMVGLSSTDEFSYDGAFLILKDHDRVRIIETSTGEVISSFLGEGAVPIPSVNQFVTLGKNSTAIRTFAADENIWEIPNPSQIVLTTNDYLFLLDEHWNLEKRDLSSKDLISSIELPKPSRSYTESESLIELMHWAGQFGFEALSMLFQLAHKPDAYDFIDPGIPISINAGLEIARSENGQLAVFGADEQGGASPKFYLDAEDILPSSLRFSEDGLWIIGLNSNRDEFLIWNTQNDELQERIRVSASVIEYIIAPKGDLLFARVYVSPSQNNIMVWSIPDGAVVQSLVSSTRITLTNGNWRECIGWPIALSGDGDKFVYSGDGCELHIVGVEDWETVQTIKPGTWSYIRAALNADGSILAVAGHTGFGGDVSFFSIETGMELFSFTDHPTRFNDPVMNSEIGFSADGKFFMISRGEKAGEIAVYGLWER